MKSKILKVISILIIIYLIYILYSYKLIFREAMTDFEEIVKIFLPVLCFSLSVIIYGIGSLLEEK